jgi:hypothetical protein
MPFIVETWDKPSHQHILQKTRREHIEFLDTIAFRFIACGVKWRGGGSDAAGGIYISDADTRAEAEPLIGPDPFTAAALYESAKIRRWRKAFVGDVCHL